MKKTDKKATTKKVKTTKKTVTKTATKKAVKKNVEPDFSQVAKSKPKIYLSFSKRVFFNALFFLCFITLCFLAASKTIEREKTNPINYTDVNDVKYKVYLKPNGVYRDKYLDMNRAYVANLIDHIDIDFNYLFNIEKITNMNFDYKIMANLVIENNNGVKFVDEEYTLSKLKSEKLVDSGTINILDSVVIDYDYYNELANNFKNSTGVDMTSYLNIFFVVDKKTDDSLNYNIKESVKSNIKIPLSERAIEINLTTDKGVVNKQVIPKGRITFNPIYLASEILLFIFSCIFLLKLISLLFSLVKVKTPYDKYIKKILKNYDRVIVELSSDVDLSDCKIIDVKDFRELLDVRDNLKLPIVYSNIIKHEKGVFYIKNNIDVYRLVIKGTDL